MGLFDNKNKQGDISMSLDVVAGKENLKLGFMKSKVKMAQTEQGTVYFDSLPNEYFRLMDYSWTGPTFKNVTTTNEKGTTKSRGKEKTRRKGGLGGAAVGTLLMPGVGTAIGYAMTSKKVKKGRGKTKTNNNIVVNENQVETDSTASIQVASIETGKTFSIGIRCNSKIDVELDRFDWSTVSEINNAEDVSGMTETDKINLLKEYKGLLDAGILSSEEFEQKKSELLG